MDSEHASRFYKNKVKHPAAAEMRVKSTLQASTHCNRDKTQRSRKENKNFSFVYAAP
jgi:hypothetical protein